MHTKNNALAVFLDSCKFNYLQVSCVLALGTVIPCLRVNLPDSLLHESHIGTIRSPVTAEFMTCAPRVGTALQPETEQFAGHALLANLIQWFFHVPHLQLRSAVPTLLDQPVVGILMRVSIWLLIIFV